MLACSDPNPYEPGDRVRVLVDEPYNTPLAQGEIVTVVGVGSKVEPDGTEGPMIIVATNLGQFYLYLDVVEAVDSPVRVDGALSLEELGYLPAEPDAATEDALLQLLDADSDLRAFFLDADTALGAEAPDVSGQLATATQEKEVWGDVPPSDVLSGSDSYGDEFQIVFDDGRRTDGDRAPRFFLSVNDSDDVIISPYYMHQLLHWVAARLRRSQDPGA